MKGALSRLRSAVALAVLAGAVGCGDDPSGGLADAGADGGGPSVCGNCGGDAGGSDGGVADGGQDAGAVDAGQSDGGEVDAGAVDAGAVDAGSVDAGSDAGVPDAGVDAGPIHQIESEPNAGVGPLDTDAFTIPGRMFGQVDAGRDLDILTADLFETELWEFRVAPGDAGSLLAPHLAVAEHSPNNVSPFTPNWVGSGEVDGGFSLEVFVHRGGRHNFFVRDARNVASGANNFGGFDYHWRIEAERLTRAPVAVAVPGSLATSLAHRHAIGVHSFTLATTTDVDMEVIASGNLDPQLGLYDLTRNTYVRTNDDRQTGVENPLLTGVLQPGNYLLIVNNVDSAATTFGYTIQITQN